MISFPQSETIFILPGPAGDLEVLASPDVKGSQTSAIGIICHPHPLHGGTMNNKVVTTLARVFKDLGLRSVRFNFRGVGKSAGKFDQGKGEVNDLLAVVEWVKTIAPEVPIWLGGFSFGAAVSAYAATQIPVARLVSIAPPVPRFDLTGLPPILCPWVVVQGDQDEIVEPEAVFNWIETLNPKPVVIRMEGAGHFFHGRLLELRSKLEEVLV